MKKHSFISPLVLLAGLFLVTFMIACKKDKETVGPTGPAGPAGPKGDTGAGSSNVIYSEWLDLNFKADTIKSGVDIDTIGYYIDIDAPLLTLELLSTADVKIYLNTSNADDPIIYPLPYSGISGLNIEVSAYTKGIQLYANSDVSTYSANGKKFNQFRYMIIPGTGQARLAAQVNWSDYASVKRYLGLKD